MKKLIVLTSLIVVITLLLTGCTEDQQRSSRASSDSKTAAKQERMMKEAEAQTGLPAIKNFQEKKMLKMLYELRDREDLICHAYLVNKMEGTVGQYLGKCIGYGLPASTQYSNPEKVTVNEWDTGYEHSGGVYGTLPQAEPNGLFMPEGLSATWLMMIDPETSEPRPVYIEPEIIVSPFKLK